MQAPGRRVVMVLVLALALVQGWSLRSDAPALAAPIPIPGAPFTPVALMQQAEARCTGDRFTFSVFGDSYDRAPLVSLLEMVDSRSPDFVLTVGDMVEKGIGEEGRRQWAAAAQHTGWFLRAHPTWPVIGNHEVDYGYESGLENFRDFYGLEGQSYSFVFRNSKFIVLGMDEDDRPVPPEQVAFARRELADRDRYDHVFVFRHVPFYTVGMREAWEIPNTETELTKLFEEGRVTAVFSGHEHYYYRTCRRGVTQIISGEAGSGIFNLDRLAEQVPGDAYMGVSKGEDQVMLHVPGRVDRATPFKGYYPSGDELLFAVFIHVNGREVTGETVSLSGEVWDSFPLAGDGFGPIGVVKAPPVTE